QLPTPATAGQTAAVEKLQSLQASVGALEAAEARDKQALAAIESLRAKIQTFVRQMERFGTETSAQAIALGIPAAAASAFVPGFRGDVDAPLLARSSELQAQIATRRGSSDAPAPTTLLGLRAEVLALQKTIGEDKAKRDRIVKQTSRIAELDKESTRLLNEI